MKISIIVPVYNVEQYVGKCIESILAQTYADIEILLVNDGSTDGSVAICEKYEKNYSKIRMIHQENGGPSDARNTGILHATGDYILFLDSDDYWKTDFLNELVNYASHTENPDYIFFRYSYFYQKSLCEIEQMYPFQETEFNGKNGTECLHYVLTNVPNFHWYAVTGLVKRELIITHSLLFEKGRKYEDALWTPNVFLHANSIGYFDKSVVVYRLEREGQITSDHSYPIFIDSLYVVEKWYRELQGLQICSKLKKMLLNNLSERYFYCLKYAAFLQGYEREQLLTLLKKNKHLRQYSNKKMDSFILLLSRVLGFKGTSLLLKYLLQLKKGFKTNSTRHIANKNKKMGASSEYKI